MKKKVSQEKVLEIVEQIDLGLKLLVLELEKSEEAVEEIFEVFQDKIRKDLVNQIVEDFNKEGDNLHKLLESGIVLGGKQVLDHGLRKKQQRHTITSINKRSTNQPQPTKVSTKKPCKSRGEAWQTTSGQGEFPSEEHSMGAPSDSD